MTTESKITPAPHFSSLFYITKSKKNSHCEVFLTLTLTISCVTMFKFYLL